MTRTWRDLLRTVGSFARTRGDTSRASCSAAEDEYTRGVNAGRRYAFDLIADECQSLALTAPALAEALWALQQLEQRADRRERPADFAMMPRGQA